MYDEIPATRQIADNNNAPPLGAVAAVFDVENAVNDASASKAVEAKLQEAQDAMGGGAMGAGLGAMGGVGEVTLPAYSEVDPEGVKVEGKCGLEFSVSDKL